MITWGFCVVFIDFMFKDVQVIDFEISSSKCKGNDNVILSYHLK